jgi:TrpR-related protein YerC/YecD
MKSWKTPKLKHLAKALLSLKTEGGMLDFLRDVATLEELESLSSRWDVVLELNKGTSYRDIAKKTGVSTATITRISHWLKHGEGGYRSALKKIKKP